MVGPVYCSVSATAPPLQSSAAGGLVTTQAVNWTLKRQDGDAHSIRLEHWLRTKMGRPLTSNPQAPVTVSTRPVTVVVLSSPPAGTVAQLIATVQVKLL